MRRIIRILFLEMAASSLFRFPLMRRARMCIYRGYFPIGEGSSIGTHVTIREEHRLNPDMKGFVIGREVSISDRCLLDCSRPIRICDYVWLSHNVQLLGHFHEIEGRELKKNQRIYAASPLVLERDCWIGANAIVLPRVRRIGVGSIVGAGSVVTGDVPDWQIVAGNPARKVGMRMSADRSVEPETG